MFLENYWYCAALPREVTAKPLRRVICNQPVVLFRGSQGCLVALEDRCSHRQAPLSTGDVRGNNIQCAYHGFVFDNAGVCVHIPHQDTIPSRAHIHAYPVEEKWGFVWIWRGDSKRANPAKIPNLPWTVNAGRSPVYVYFHVKANHQLVADNLLDISHADYLHSNTLGSKSGIMGGPQPDSVEFRTWQEGDEIHSYRKLTNVEVASFPKKWGNFSCNVDRTNIQMWEAPNTVHVHLEFENNENKILINHDHIMTPETETSTHYFMDFTRNFGIEGGEYPTDDDIYNEQYSVISKDDLPMVEAQQENINLCTGVVDVPVKADKLISAVHRQLADMYSSRAISIPSYVLVKR
jgi:vanillate O-demethylase monooxygenase subunit